MWAGRKREDRDYPEEREGALTIYYQSGNKKGATLKNVALLDEEKSSPC